MRVETTLSMAYGPDFTPKTMQTSGVVGEGRAGAGRGG